MTPERWTEVKEALVAALDRPRRIAPPASRPSASLIRSSVERSKACSPTMPRRSFSNTLRCPAPPPNRRCLLERCSGSTRSNRSSAKGAWVWSSSRRIERSTVPLH